MKSAIATFAVGVLLILALSAWGKKSEPAVVIVCEKGGIIRHGFLLVNAGDCVGHDKYGGTFSAESLAVYEDISGGGW
jgi:hypothetical protein